MPDLPGAAVYWTKASPENSQESLRHPPAYPVVLPECVLPLRGGTFNVMDSQSSANPHGLYSASILHPHYHTSHVVRLQRIALESGHVGEEVIDGGFRRQVSPAGLEDGSLRTCITELVAATLAALSRVSSASGYRRKNQFEFPLYRKLYAHFYLLGQTSAPPKIRRGKYIPVAVTCYPIPYPPLSQSL